MGILSWGASPEGRVGRLMVARHSSGGLRVDGLERSDAVDLHDRPRAAAQEVRDAGGDDGVRARPEGLNPRLLLCFSLRFAETDLEASLEDGDALLARMGVPLHR